jgi:hypothetical protein
MMGAMRDCFQYAIFALCGGAKTAIEGAGLAGRTFVQVEPELVLRGLKTGNQVMNEVVVDRDLYQPVEAEEMQPRMRRPATEGAFEGEGVERQLGRIGPGVGMGVSFVVDDVDFTLLLEPEVDDAANEGTVDIEDEVPFAEDAGGGRGLPSEFALFEDGGQFASLG